MVAVKRALLKIGVEYRARLTPKAIVDICQRAGHAFRQRVLGPVETIHLFLLQVLNGNTACMHVRHFVPWDFTDSAYCQARGRLKLAVFRDLLTQVTERLRTSTEAFGRWLGHRVFYVDGSSFSMPDTPALQAHFGQPSEQKPGCGFPSAHLLALFDAATGFIVDVLAGPLVTHDLTRVCELHPRLAADDLLVGDRAFGTYAHLALLLQRQMHGLFRIHQTFITDFRYGRPYNRPGKGRQVKGRPRSRWIARLGRDDQIVAWIKPRQKPTWMTDEQYAALPDELQVRELRYRVPRRVCRTRQVRLVTTLLDPDRYPLADLAERYGQRWQAETDLRHLKQTMGMDVLRCKTVDGVHKEMYMYALVYNLVRCVMLEAAALQDVPPDRISFIDALRWLATAGAGVLLSDLKVNPLRPDRFEPRVVKRRPKPRTLMTKPRHQLRKELERKRVRA